MKANETIETSRAAAPKWRPATPTNLGPRERDDLFYELVAGAAKTRLIESMLDLRLLDAFADRGPLTAAEIATALDLHTTRAAKWLVLLERVGLVRDEGGQYQPTAAGWAMCWDEQGRENFFMRDMVEFCRRVNMLDFVEVLRGLPLPEAVRWPPRTQEAADHLELWMAITASEAIAALKRGTDWENTTTLLDVGGGDASVACALVNRYPHLHVTVFNLPASAALARARIERERVTSKVSVFEGNFQEDELPHGFDRVQFSRVLADWDPSVCEMLLKKARAALLPGGSVVICEPFDDTNADLAVSWEFRYTFYDDFGVRTYKSIGMYEDMLRRAGFTEIKVVDRINGTLYGVITAR